MPRPLRTSIAILAVSIAWWCPSSAAEETPATHTRSVTFYSTSDSHYKCLEKEAENAKRTATIAYMNRMLGTPWPTSLGGGATAAPRGVLCLGDCIDDGDTARDGVNWTKLQYGFFLKDFGLDGTDGLLRFPVFEGWGNHDGPPEGKEKHGFSFQAHLKERNRQRLAKGLIGRVSANGRHYSWDWDDVHFVQLNLYPADRQRAGVKYSPVWHDPQLSLTFLKEDLAAAVGTSGRPVVLMSHCGFDTDWWSKDDWAAMYEAVKDYRIVLYLYGHTGTGVRDWAPEGATRRWLTVNDGHTDTGFFIVEMTDDRLRLGQRIRRKAKDGTETWEWANLRQVPLDPPGTKP